MSHQADPFPLPSTKAVLVGWAACFTAFFALVAAFPEIAGGLFVAYSLGLVWASIVLAIPPTDRLLKYLKLHHREQWAQLVFFPSMPWNCPNSMAILQFLLARNQSHDAVLQALK